MARFLHTADWHLGRAFHGEDLLRSQAEFVDFAVEAARSSKVDGILLAGDLYDRALPPVDAVRLASEALFRLSEVAPVVVISGNHDSAARLGFGAELFARAQVHIATDPAQIGTPVAVGGALIYPLPYLEPDLVRAPLGVEERSHAAVTGAAMERVRADIAARGARRRAGDRDGARLRLGRGRLGERARPRGRRRGARAARRLRRRRLRRARPPARAADRRRRRGPLRRLASGVLLQRGDAEKVARDRGGRGVREARPRSS